MFAASGCALVSGLSDVKVSDGNEAGVSADGSTEAATTVVCPQACSNVNPVPDGWQAVVRRKDASTSCAANTTTIDLTAGIADPKTACPCACSVTTMPSCTAGDRPIHFGDQCSVQGSFVSGKCAPSQSATVSGNYDLDPIAPSGGSCGTPSTAPSMAGKTTVRACGMPQGCSGVPCAGADETSCIVRSGAALACPSDYPQSTSLGTDVSVSCTCSGTCTLQTTCANPALHLYSDNQCTMEIVAIPADGKCNSSGASGKPLGSYKYDATVQASCTSSMPGTPAIALVGPTTMCCKP